MIERTPVPSKSDSQESKFVPRCYQCESPLSKRPLPSCWSWVHGVVYYVRKRRR